MAENPRIEELRRRVHLDPASIAFAALAEEFRRMGRHEDAIETCRSGLLRHPAYLSARVTLGRALIETGDYDGAREELETVLRSAPENLAAIRGLAQISERLGQSTEMDPHLAALMNAEVERIALAAAARPAPQAVETRPHASADTAIVEVAPEPAAPPVETVAEAATEIVLEATPDAAVTFYAEPAFQLDRLLEAESALAGDPVFDLDASFDDPVEQPGPDPVMLATLARLERFLVAIDAARHP